MNQLSFSKSDKKIIRAGITNILLIGFLLVIFLVILFIYNLVNYSAIQIIIISIFIFIIFSILIHLYTSFISKILYSDDKIKILTALNEKEFSLSDIKETKILERKIRRLITLSILFSSNEKSKKYYIMTDYIIDDKPENLVEKLNSIFRV